MPSNKHALASLLPLLVAALTVVAFLPVLRNGFVDWDDILVIVTNPNYRGLGWTQLSWMFTTFYASLYRPLAWVTLGLDYSLWGMDPAGYHLTSVVFHAVNAALVYFIALRLLHFARPDAEFGRHRFAAAIAALFFALHPLRVEPVAWVSARSDPLGGFFIFTSLLCYLRALKSASQRQWLAFAWLSYGLSLLSKASGTTFPLVLLLLDFYPLRRLGGASGALFGAAARRVWLEKIPFLTLSAAAAVVAVVAKRQGGLIFDYPPLTSVQQSAYAILFYPLKTAAPYHLSPIYPVPDAADLWRWPIVVYPIIVIALTIAAFVVRHRRPAVFTSWMSYVALVVPVSGVIKYGPQFVVDRYTYLPDVVWAVAIGALALVVCERWPRMIFPTSAAAAFVLSALAFLTWDQTKIWHDSGSLFLRATAVAPRSVIAHHNLAGYLAAEGRTNEAIAYYERALAIRPYAEGHAELGKMLAAQGKTDAAIEHEYAAIRLDGAYLPARQTLALLFIQAGRLDDAAEEYRAAIKIDPSFVEGHNNLGLILASQHRVDEAIGEYREALRLKPDFALAHANLGKALLVQGKTAEAAFHLRTAAALDPKSPQRLEQPRAAQPSS